MVATSLPFWMQHPSRTMLPFLADLPARQADVRQRGPRRMPPNPGAIVVEACAPLAIEGHIEAWADLATRAVEPNVFMEPGFAFPAVLHFAPAQRPTFLLCWEQAGADNATLIGLLALHERATLTAVAAAWHHPQSVMSAPLLDRHKGAAALDAMLGWLALQPRFGGGLLVRGVPLGGALMRLLDDGGRRAVAVLDTRSRAILEPDGGASRLGAKQKKELRRQNRRLGGSEVRSARSVDEIRAATERFLELEARGWKGARGTALLCDVHLATFTRTMTRLMAMQGLCRIDTLEVGGDAVAMGIVLRSGDRAFFWKTAYDETRRRQSPGKQLALATSLLQCADATLTMTDSCAVPDHPMIDPMWTGRMQVVDLLVSGPAHSTARFRRAVLMLRLAGRSRETVKRLYHGSRNRFSRR